MFAFLILVVAYFVALGYFIEQNNGQQVVSLFAWAWTVPAWLPVASAGVIMFLLMLLLASYGSARHGIRHWTLGRRISEHKSTIGQLREGNNRLRSEVERLKRRLEADGSAPSVRERLAGKTIELTRRAGKTTELTRRA
jgi:hypothetical protein